MRNSGFSLLTPGHILVTGSDQSFEPFYAGLPLSSNKRYGESDKVCTKDVLEISGSNSHYEGIVFAPRGKVVYNGSNHTVIEGAIVADTVTFSGSNSGIVGGAETSGPPLVRLIR